MKEILLDALKLSLVRIGVFLPTAFLCAHLLGNLSQRI